MAASTVSTLRRVESLIAEGSTRPEALRRARIEFGGIEQVKDEAREARVAGPAERIARGLRMAAKSLARSPGFTAVAALIPGT